ncbi:MAG TPA: hypothetical protein VN381_03020 [Anaerovoracaceae bacterium]|nr:hypothetical protein [Anaerovoracaceae bacterium]
MNKISDEVSETTNKYLKKMSEKVRHNLITMLSFAGSGHPGGSLSIVEVLTILYYGILKFDPSNVHKPDRDRLVSVKRARKSDIHVILADLDLFPIKS